MIVMVIMIKIIINKLNNSNHRERLIIILVTMETFLETGFKKQGVSLIFQLCHMLCISTKTITFLSIYLYFFSCYSYVGKIGGSQPINLERRCWSSGIVAHEIGNLFI